MRRPRQTAVGAPWGTATPKAAARGRGVWDSSGEDAGSKTSSSTDLRCSVHSPVYQCVVL